MSMQEMTDLFSADGLLKKAAVFDPKKLEWMNGQHMSLASARGSRAARFPLAVAAGFTTAAELKERREWWLTLLDLLRVRARTTHDIVRQAATYFSETVRYDDDAVAKHWKDRAASASTLEAVRRRLENTEWNAEALEQSLRVLAEELQTSSGKVFHRYEWRSLDSSRVRHFRRVDGPGAR
jgi:glutamyl/glutaminyl-tRNA synthetase